MDSFVYGRAAEIGEALADGIATNTVFLAGGTEHDHVVLDCPTRTSGGQDRRDKQNEPPQARTTTIRVRHGYLHSEDTRGLYHPAAGKMEAKPASGAPAWRIARLA